MVTAVTVTAFAHFPHIVDNVPGFVLPPLVECLCQVGKPSPAKRGKHTRIKGMMHKLITILLYSNSRAAIPKQSFAYTLFQTHQNVKSNFSSLIIQKADNFQFSILNFQFSNLSIDMLLTPYGLQQLRSVALCPLVQLLAGRIEGQS